MVLGREIERERAHAREIERNSETERARERKREGEKMRRSTLTPGILHAWSMHNMRSQCTRLKFSVGE